ncbi:MAG: glycosyltransferase family 39 protein, partial [Planctomycetales bacterium]|nr:glycosyltransferase family 39 protein [Planctomycetales bacterium]
MSFVRDSSPSASASLTDEPHEQSGDGASGQRMRVNIDSRWMAVARNLFLLAVATVIGMHQVDETGFLWADAPRYANGAAMIHDWLISGEWLHPYQFAQRYYCRYPGFNIPYHPPAYPGMMALLFLVFGVSYATARFFIALCLGFAGIWFVQLAKRLGAKASVAFGGGLLLMTTPGIAYWSRTTMSEIPSLMVIMLATLLFVGWLDTAKPRYCWAAYVVAIIAFLSRMVSAGVLPAWFLYAIATRRFRLLLSPHNIAGAAIYLVFGASWVRWIKGFGLYEGGGEAAHLRLPDLQPNPSITYNLAYHWKNLPTTIGWPAIVCGALALALMVLAVKKNRGTQLWIMAVSWFVSLWIFLFVLSLREHNEPRYFCLGLPSMAIMITALCSWGFAGSRTSRIAAAVALGSCLCGNIYAMTKIPHGVVGYQRVAELLANQDQRGNILTACPRDQDFIFRYRAAGDKHVRQVMRSDRTLAIRAPNYVVVPAKVLAANAEQMIDTIRRGRIRYIITSTPPDPKIDERYREMKMAHEVASQRPDLFRPLGETNGYPLLIELGGDGRKNFLHVWEFTGELPPGP